MCKNEGTGDLLESYSPYLESDLLSSKFHCLDFEVHSYEGDQTHAFGLLAPAFLDSFNSCANPPPPTLN